MPTLQILIYQLGVDQIVSIVPVKVLIQLVNSVQDLGIYYPTRLPTITAQILGGARQIILGLGSRSMGRQSGTYFSHSPRVLL